MLPLFFSFQVPPSDRLRAASVYAGFVVLSASACGPESELPLVGELQYKGEYVDIYASSGTTICKGSFEEIDRFSHQLRLHAEETSVPWIKERFRYNWLTQQEWLSVRPCDSDGAACHKVAFLSEPATIYARELLLHEVVHAMYGPAYQSHSIFNEGLAEILADGKGDALPTFSEVSFSSLFADVQDGLNLLEYNKAAFATRFLLDQHNELGLKIITSTTRHSSTAEFERVLAADGLSLEELDNRLFDAVKCGLEGSRINLPECTSEHIDWITISDTAMINLACDADGTHGPTQGEIYRTFSFTVPYDGAYIITILSTDEITGKLGRCGRILCGYTDSRSSLLEVSLSSGPELFVSLEAGKHWMTLYGSTETNAEIEISLRPVGTSDDSETPAPEADTGDLDPTDVETSSTG